MFDDCNTVAEVLDIYWDEIKKGDYLITTLQSGAEKAINRIKDGGKKMRKVVIAFDVDGTLIQNGATSEWDMKPNRRIVRLLEALASFKNVRIVVWSGAGKEWADSAVKMLDIGEYVKATYDKNLVGRGDNGHPLFEPDITPDIAIDDIQACDLGVLNLIVKEK